MRAALVILGALVITVAGSFMLSSLGVHGWPHAVGGILAGAWAVATAEVA